MINPNDIRKKYFFTQCNNKNNFKNVAKLLKQKK